MSDALNRVYGAIDEEHAEESASTRRQLVAGATGVLGTMGLLAVPGVAGAQELNRRERREMTDQQTILNVAATAEVLATIVNTVALERLTFDPQTTANIQAAAREELIHFEVLTSKAVGGKPATRRIWVPDAVFSSQDSLLKTLVTGDQIFVNAYLVGTTSFGNSGNGRLARITAEFMGVEAVHRALALQSLGALGNDRVFMKYSQIERNQNDALAGKPGFRRITTAVRYLKGAGFGFGEQGATPGAFYDFNEVSRRTPNPPGLNTTTPR